MGLFDKKYCDICGDKIGLLGNRKLEDGNLCKNCAKKLSFWFDERRHSTVEQIRQQLAYREDNRSKAEAFNITRTFGRDIMKLYVDDSARKFTIHSGSDFAAGNPDILDFSQAVGCELEISESRDEIRRTVDGRTESYNPPRYNYSYDFKVTIRVDHPYFDEMHFDLNSRSVETGEQQMSGGDPGAWSINRAGSILHGNRGVGEYSEFIQLGNDLKTMIDSWKNSASAPDAESKQSGSIDFASTQPVPYSAQVNGAPIAIRLKYSGSVYVDAADPSLLQSRGGIEALEDILRTELLTAANEVLYRCSTQGISFSNLPAKLDEISEQVKSSLGSKWASQYGLTIDMLSFFSFDLTEESMQEYLALAQAQMAQANIQQQVQEAAQQNVRPVSESRTCPFCGTPNVGKFCPNCGAKQ